MTLMKKISAPLLMVGLASPALVNCDALGGMVGADCTALKDGNFADLKLSGSADVQAKFKGFLEAIYNLDKLAVDVEVGLIDSCKELGMAIGADEAQLSAEPAGGEGAKQACGAAAAKVEGILSAAGSVSLSLDIGEPRCEVDITAMNDCLGECGAAVEPGEFSAACEGGEVSGTCSGECSGTCTLDAGAGCSGTCEGVCNGTCDGEESSGQCAGKCEGECSATCKVEGSADCQGSCSGGCSVDLEAPSCSGEFKPPSVSVDCHAGCVAKTAGSAKCYPPSLDVKIEGEASADVEKLVAGLQVALPKVVKIQLGTAKKAVAIGETIVTGAQELPSMAGSLGLSAIGCATMAVEMATGATASLSVSVEASASVSASASGGAEGG